MFVTDIEITGYRYCPQSARHLANVCMTLRNQVVTMLCQIDLPENESPASRAAAFVRDATRQLRRMPEIRSGQANLSFAETISPDRIPLAS